MAAYNEDQDPTTGNGTTPAAPGLPTTTGDEPYFGFDDQLRALYQKYLQRNPTPQEVTAHRGNPGGLLAVEQLLQQSGTAATLTPPTTGSTPGAPSSTIGSLTAPFGESFTAPGHLTGPPSYLPATPTFTPPGFTKPPPFAAPSIGDMLQEPGYQFRVGQGEQALEQSAAARGVLNTGGTLKDLLNYGQQFASGEYGNVYNRAANTYAINYGSQYLDPYRFAYQSALDQFSPQMTAYSTQAQAGQRADELNYANRWNEYMQRWQAYRAQQSDVFDRLFRYATV